MVYAWSPMNKSCELFWYTLFLIYFLLSRLPTVLFIQSVLLRYPKPTEINEEIDLIYFYDQ